jgi:hypothetical protein
MTAYFIKVKNVCPEEVSSLLFDAALDVAVATAAPYVSVALAVLTGEMSLRVLPAAGSSGKIFRICRSPTPELVPSTCQSVHALNL